MDININKLKSSEKKYRETIKSIFKSKHKQLGILGSLITQSKKEIKEMINIQLKSSENINDFDKEHYYRM